MENQNDMRVEENEFGTDVRKPDTKQEKKKKKKVSTAMKIGILVVLVILLAAGILLPIKLVPNAVSSIAGSISAFFKPKQEVTLSADKTSIETGETVNLSWSGKHRTDGTHSLSYPCTEGVRVEAVVGDGNEPITCDSTYYFTPEENAVSLVAYSDTDRFADVNATLGFLENGAATIDTIADITITITNSKIAASGSTSTTGSTTVIRNPGTSTKPTAKPTSGTSAGVVSNPNGLANLEVRPIATGYLAQNGTFIPSSTVAADQQAAVKFSIVNVGDKNTGTWSFVVDIPSVSDPRYTSGPQQNLGPGDRIEYVLGFQNLKDAVGNVVTIQADPQNTVPELTDANNIARMLITRTGPIGSPQQPTSPSTPGARADLSAKILSTGVVNRTTGAYTPTNTVGALDKVGIRFEVYNSGGTATGPWRFEAILPTSDYLSTNYTSDIQPSLAPGQKFTFMVHFEDVRNQGSNNPITIFVDAENKVLETNDLNNTATTSVFRN